MRVQGQLINSMIEKKTDSIGFYQDEVNYMRTQIDSMNKEISKADTLIKIGLLAFCKFPISRTVYAISGHNASDIFLWECEFEYLEYTND